MALSMDEQRALAEIERRLAADDPGLATCLTAFRRCRFRTARPVTPRTSNMNATRSIGTRRDAAATWHGRMPQEERRWRHHHCLQGTQPHA